MVNLTQKITNKSLRNVCQETKILVYIMMKLPLAILREKSENKQKLKKKN